MKNQTRMPRARSKNLVVQPLEDETLVYDLDCHKAHCLNKTARFVWNSCDGQATIGDVTTRIHKEFGLPADSTVVAMAIDQLKKAKLIDPSSEALSTRPGTSRREAIKRIGLIGGTAALLPLVTSILAPTAAEASTCVAMGGLCSVSADCCSGACDTTQVPPRCL